ncbi:UDP-glucose/GDP-mannose dehydrogenase family protein [Mycolicibacterium sp.]|uniref:UDP-glucose dehydrogenase family protein n=1 Tax=Mycolicibacterium sp. TaxID=2320850 RepID=UPI001A1E11C5|nr:UDP-glucose/GDP-mannose dehydrogenase family protein [Mycolicibacterium sp.]MBJ7336712.1 UDP-glucose/GDP-mannose dehydrogenase family protein [Mycolicibacterium sp.]
MRLAVYGAGYLGATHAACMAALGHEVIGVEIDSSKLSKLRAGELPFFEPELTDELQRHLANGRLRFTESYAETADWADAHFICVGTPQKKGEFAADISHVNTVVKTLVPLLNCDALIIGKSTVPVGTAAQLVDTARDLAANFKVEICWNPEFLREGHAVKDTLHPDRLVVGIEAHGRAEQVMREIYSRLIDDGVPFLVTDLATAELVKVSANAFLATKISFINAIADVCEAAGADVQAVADAIGHDPRIGRQFLNAGLGFGGGCLPKDIRAFMARAGELGAGSALTFLREVDAINMRRRTRMVELARETVKSFPGTRVAILGAAFKPESDDVRDSPALNVAGQIQLQGAAVTVYDPQAMDNSRRLFPTLDYATSALEACRGADLVLVLTEWEEFTALTPEAVGAVTKSRSIIDGRQCLDRALWERAGWSFFR